VTRFYTLPSELQPLDIAVHRPLKLCFEQAICVRRSGRIVNQYVFAKIFASAYLRVVTPQNAINWFQFSLILHYNFKFSLMLIMLQLLPLITIYRFYSRSSRYHPEIPQPCAYKFSLWKTETPLSNESLTQCDQLKRGLFAVTLHMIFTLVWLLSNVLNCTKKEMTTCWNPDQYFSKKLQREKFIKGGNGKCADLPKT
jgi:hypothetical protein